MLSSDAAHTNWCVSCHFGGGIRPPYFVMSLGFCFVLSSGALFNIAVSCRFEGGLRPPHLITSLGILLCAVIWCSLLCWVPSCRFWRWPSATLFHNEFGGSALCCHLVLSSVLGAVLSFWMWPSAALLHNAPGGSALCCDRVLLRPIDACLVILKVAFGHLIS